MIQANELRIGNLVNVPREDQSPFWIDAFEYLSNTYIKVAMTHPEFGDKMHPLTWYDEDLKPIPLTEEWLFKFGFELNGCNFELPNFRFHVNKPINYNGFIFCDGCSVITEKIQFVHQLQNLYFCLTGAELTVA